MSLWIQIITSVCIVIFLLFGIDWLAINYFHSPDAIQILKYFAIYFLGINIFQIITSIFSAFQDMFNAKLIDFVKIFSTLIFTLLFFIFGLSDILYYSLAWIIGLVVSLWFWLIIFAKKYHKILFKWKIVKDKSFLSKYWKYSLWTFLSLNVAVLMIQMDQQMVIVMLWAESAWYYTNYLSIRQILLLLVSPIFVLILPLFTEMISKKKYNDISILQNFLYTYLSFLASVYLYF